MREVWWKNSWFLQCDNTSAHTALIIQKFLMKKKNPLKTVLFSVITQRVAVISYWCFGTTYHSHLQGSRIQKESRLSQYGVYIGQSVGSDKCQPIGLVLVVRRVGECGSQCSFEERCSIREEILRGAVARPRRLSTWVKCEKGKERLWLFCFEFFYLLSYTVLILNYLFIVLLFYSPSSFSFSLSFTPNCVLVSRLSRHGIFTLA